MSTIVHCKKRRLSKCNGSWVVAIKQTVNFKYQPPTMFVFFLFYAKIVLLKVVHPLNTYQNTKFHNPLLSDTRFAFTSEVWTSAFWNGWIYSIKNYGVEVTFNGMTSLLNLIKLYQLVQKFMGWGQTDTQTGWWSHKPTFSFRKESRLENAVWWCIGVLATAF
jgi:hypothetical protein